MNRRRPIVPHSARAHVLAIILAGLVSGFGVRPAAAASVRGEVITLVSPNSAGGMMTRYARMIAPYIAKHAGAADVRIRVMTGGGGIRGSNYVWFAEPDGRTIAFTSVPSLILAGLSLQIIPFNWIGLLLILTGIGLMVAWIYLNPASALTRALEFRPLAYLGVISYGVYMYQGILLATGPHRSPGSDWPPEPLVGFVLLCIIAPLSFHYLERPLLRIKARYSATEASVPRIASAERADRPAHGELNRAG